MDKSDTPTRTYKKLSPDEYYYNEQGLLVFTETYHKRRGYCCKSNCKHCPYGYETKKQSNISK